MPGTSVLFRTIYFFVLTFSILISRAHAHEAGDLKTFVNFEGEIEVMVSDDFEQKQSTKHYFVKDHTGKKKELQLAAGMKDPELQTGQRVSVKGHVHSKKSDKIYLDQPVAALDGGSTAAIGVVTTTTATSKNILTIITDFNDGTVSCTDTQVQNIMFSADPAAFSVANYYKETSKGKLAVQGQVVRVKLSENIGTCEATMDAPNRWMTAARTEAAKQISLTGFTNTIVVLPTSTPCPWSGLGGLGYGSAWVKRCEYGSVYAHEFGHNLGMHHASSPGADYGDGSDVMGGGYAPVNAPHSISRGWTPLGNVLEVKASGVYRISSLESDPALVASYQALKIYKEDTREFYYFSLREAVGLFGQRFISSSYANRLNVHTFGAQSETVIRGTRGLGEAYIDSVNGLTITPVALVGNEMDVQIDINVPCTRRAPTLSVSGISGVVAGQATSVYAYIQNNDSYFCPNSVFNLDVSSLPGLAVSTDKSSIEIKSASSGYYVINILPDLTLVNGTYNLTTTAVDAADSSRSLSGSFAVSVGVTTTTKGKGKGRRR